MAAVSFVVIMVVFSAIALVLYFSFRKANLI